VLKNEADRLPLPPGANLVLCVLAVNIVVGGMVRLRRSWRTAGVLVVHLGIGLLLVSGFIKTYFSSEGHLTLFEGQLSNAYQSYYRWEVSIARQLAGGELHEVLAEQEQFVDATGTRSALYASDDRSGTWICGCSRTRVCP